MSLLLNPTPPMVAPPPGSGDHQKCLNVVLKCLSDVEPVHTVKVQQWQELFRAFYAQRGTSDRLQLADWQSDVRSPYVQEQALNLLPRLVSADPKVDYIPMQHGTPFVSTKAASRVVNAYNERDNFFFTQARAMLPAIITGVSWVKTGWMYNERTRWVKAQPYELAQTGQSFTQKRIVLDDRASDTVCHPYDVLEDPRAVTMETCGWIIHRTFMSVGQVHARQRMQRADGTWTGVYENTQYVKGKGGHQRDRNLPNEIPAQVTARMKDDECEILELWHRELDRTITIANRHVVLRDVQMPYDHCDLPFQCVITHPDVMRLNGLSEVQALMGLQSMLWLIENQRLDNMRLSLDTVLLIRDTIENFDELVLEPGAKWPLQNPQSDVVPFQMQPPPLASMQDIEQLRGRLQSILGLGYLGGADPNASGFDQNTASGLASLQEEANRRVDFRLSVVRSLFLKRNCDQKLQLAQQFMTEPLHAPQSDGDVLGTIDPALIAPRMWVTSRLLTDTMSKSLKGQQLQQNLGAFIQLMNLGMPLPGGQVPNPMPFLEQFADLTDHEVDDFLMPNPQPPAPQTPTPQEKLIETLAYKDAPPDIQRQIEAQAGFQPSQQPALSPSQQPLVSAAHAAATSLHQNSRSTAQH